MTISAIPLVSVLWLSLAAPASAQSVLARCDRPLSTVDILMDESFKCSERLAKALPAAAVVNTTGTGSFEINVDIPANAIPTDISEQARTEAMSQQLRTYFVYDAFVHNDESRCEAVRGVQVMHNGKPGTYKDIKEGERRGGKQEKSNNFVQDCVDEKQAMDLLKSWFGPPAGLAAACEKLNDPEIKMSKACCATLARVKDDAGACSQLVPSCIKETEFCRGLLRGMSGVGNCRREQPSQNGCQTGPNCEAKYQKCLGDVAFGLAAKMKEPKRCGANNRCRVLVGEGDQVLKELGAELNKSEAGRWFLQGGWRIPSKRKMAAPEGSPAPPAVAQPPPKLASSLQGFTCQLPLNSQGNIRMAADLFSLAESCLASVEGSLKAGEAAKLLEIDQKREELARTRMRFEALMSGKNKAPGKAKP